MPKCDQPVPFSPPTRKPEALPNESAKKVLIISLNAPNSADTAMPDRIILTGLTPF